MAKFTAIVDAQTGELIGGAHGHVGHGPGTAGDQSGTKDGSGGLIAGPGQRIEHIEIPDQLAQIDDPAELHAQLQAHLRK